MRPALATALVLLLALVCGRDARPVWAEEDPVAKRFRELDLDGNRTLSQEEYLKRPGNQQVHRRDFQMFDFDKDGILTPTEFAAIPGLIPPYQRGPLPDPFEGLLQEAIAALDESYNNWDRRPTGKIPTQVFVANFINSISGGRLGVSSALRAQADPDRDGQVTREEARGFLERQLGIRAPNGDPLREANGRVVNWKRFYWLDADSSGSISREEFIAKGGANAAEAFAAGDRNGDGEITWEEYCHPEWTTGHEDPVLRFREADTNFDGLLDVAELDAALTGGTAYRKALAPVCLAAFDFDSDGKLSLDEYRVSMLGNWICNWIGFRQDKNRDQAITFDEFLYEPESFLLLQRLYFHYLDRDADGRLVKQEYPFEENPFQAFYRLAADGSRMDLLFRDPQYPNGGSPEISPDGEWLAFDLYPDGKLLLMPANGGPVRELCPGLMPSWSADSQFLTYSWDGSIWIVSAEGSNARRIAPGWGAQWSPDGKTIAYTNNGGLWAYDVLSGQSREVLPRQLHPYLMLYYGMTWSPDSRRVALKATKHVGSDIISVNMTGGPPEMLVHFSTELSLSHDLSWSADGRRLLFSHYAPEHKRNLLHQLDLESEDGPMLFPGVNPALTYLNSSFSRDGSWIVVTAK
jgi:TolB protein